MAHQRSQHAPPVPGEFGPNDHHWDGGTLKPGLGADHKSRSRFVHGGVIPEDPPEKAALRTKAAQLKQVELQQLERAAELERKEAELVEKEAQLNAALTDAGLVADSKKK